jgi:hypothetical protein
MAGPAAAQAEDEERAREPEDPGGAYADERVKPTGRANRLAVTALICATCVPFLLVGGILATVFGLVALDEIDEADGAERGRGIAQWAVGLGLLNVVVGCAVVVLAVVAISS